MKLTGDWALARRLLAGAGARVAWSIDAAVREEALRLQREIVLGLRNQAPGGRPIRPLAPTTLAKRQMRRFRGTKALIDRGDLLRSITTEVKDGVAFVGVSRKARTRDGSALVDVAARNELGAAPVAIPLTPKSRRFLFALLAQATGLGGGGGPRVPGAVVVRTPARPFLRPAFERSRKGAAERFLRRVAKGLFG